MTEIVQSQIREQSLHEDMKQPVEKLDEITVNENGTSTQEQLDLMSALENFVIQILPPPPSKPQQQFDINALIKDLSSKNEKAAQQTLLTEVHFQKKQEQTQKQAPEPVPIDPIQPFKSTVLEQTLNPESPMDKALALSLRMVRKRKERQANQLKMLAEYRSRVKIEEQHLSGDISRVIDKQNFIRGNRYLREEHYRTLSPKSNKKLTQSVVLPKLTIPERKTITKNQVKFLNKCKVNNRHYQAKKISLDILYQVIGKSVEFYLKKIKYPLKGAPRKISNVLAQSMVRGRIIKNGLGMSRVKEEEENKSESDASDEDDDLTEKKSRTGSDSDDEKEQKQKIDEEQQKSSSSSSQSQEQPEKDEEKEEKSEKKEAEDSSQLNYSSDPQSENKEVPPDRNQNKIRNNKNKYSKS